MLFRSLPEKEPLQPLRPETPDHGGRRLRPVRRLRTKSAETPDRGEQGKTVCRKLTPETPDHKRPETRSGRRLRGDSGPTPDSKQRLPPRSSSTQKNQMGRKLRTLRAETPALPETPGKLRTYSGLDTASAVREALSLKTRGRRLRTENHGDSGQKNQQSSKS